MRGRLLSHLVNAAEPFGDQKRRLRPLPFEQRIGADGGAVAEEFDVPGIDALIEKVADAGDDGLGRVVGGRGKLVDGDLAPVLVEIDHVGEGPAGIDGDTVSAHGAFAPGEGPFLNVLARLWSTVFIA